MMDGAADDALKIAGPRRTRIHLMVDVNPGVRRPVLSVHSYPVASVAHRHALGVVQVGQVLIRNLPDDSVHTRVPSDGSTVATPPWLITKSYPVSTARRG